MNLDTDYEKIILAVHYLERWQQDPFRWGVERIAHMIPALIKILNVVKAQIDVGAILDNSKYSSELLIAERVIDLANQIIKEKK